MSRRARHFFTELSLRDIGSVYVYAPPDFVGVMNATIALLSPSKKVIDSRPIRLEWTAKTGSLQPPNKATSIQISSARRDGRYACGQRTLDGEI
jgi:hypothetical protein